MSWTTLCDRSCHTTWCDCPMCLNVFSLQSNSDVVDCDCSLYLRPCCFVNSPPNMRCRRRPLPQRCTMSSNIRTMCVRSRATPVKEGQMQDGKWFCKNIVSFIHLSWTTLCDRPCHTIWWDCSMCLNMF